jgi:hypothetical protein
MRVSPAGRRKGLTLIRCTAPAAPPARAVIGIADSVARAVTQGPDAVSTDIGEAVLRLAFGRGLAHFTRTGNSVS